MDSSYLGARDLYGVPNNNTELQVLYWLALQNESERNDTLALAVAITNGLWVTVDYEEVREAACKDANDLLNFLRQTNEIKRSERYNALDCIKRS